MSTETNRDLTLEIAYVLFIDVVGYSKLLTNEQTELMQKLNGIVRQTGQVRAAEANGELLLIPTGDGMALVFRNRLEGPAQCAVEIGRALKDYHDIQVRMGIHSGAVNVVTDVNDRPNITGVGINVAQRVMDCGDAGHILVSKRVAEDLAQNRRWESYLHDLGDVRVKHDVTVPIFNFFGDDFGKPNVPKKIQQQRVSQPGAVGGKKSRLGIKIAIVAAALIVLAGLGYVVATRHFITSAGEKSIAVLPFENLSVEKENAFFADGIQDDLLTNLARIKDLRVISRTSVMAYRNGARNLREIGKALGVAHILEGSVRRVGDRVAVNVQLIDARNDHHIWANRYDRTLADALGLEGELASEIAEALRATLTPEEKARVEKRPTENAEAYVVFLQANQIERNPDTLLEDFKKAEQLYKQAITIDPNFALAHARLASTCAQIFHYYEPLDSWKTKSGSEADIALRLQPNLAEAHLALGQYIYWIDGDFDRALQEFGTALRLSPNNADVGALIAAIKRRQGHWQEALEAYERSQKIDPQNPNIVRNVLFTNTALRRWAEAARWAEKMRAMAPASLVAKIQSGYVDFWWKGDTRLLKSLLSQVPAESDPDGVITSCRWDVAMIDRDFGAARAALQNSALNEISYTNAGATPKSFFQGCIDLAEGKQAQAQKLFELARPNFEKAVEEAPLSADRHANLGWFYAFAGRKDEAIREGRRAVELKPESKDAVDGAIMNCYLALIYARVGEKDLALPLIERLLKTPGAVDSVDYSITINDLKYRWEWDPIRSDPRFQSLTNTQL